MAAKPFIGADAGQFSLTLFSIAFFSIAMFFAWSQGKLIDTIGKFLTPALFIGLIVLAIAVFVNPQGEIVAATVSMLIVLSRLAFLKATIQWIRLVL